MEATKSAMITNACIANRLNAHIPQTRANGTDHSSADEDVVVRHYNGRNQCCELEQWSALLTSENPVQEEPEETER